MTVAEQPRPYGLTSRQLHAAVLMAKGLSTREMAARMDTTEAGVHSLCSKILRKMDVETRAQAAVKWIREQEMNRA